MALVKRLVKGSPLTAQEMDDNLDYLEGLIPVGSTSGTSGTSGTNGTSGTGGTSGLNGANGLNGSSGTSGTTGTAGTSGLDGTNFGTAGTSGIDGTNGTAGSGGSSGTSGTSATAGGSITVRDVDTGTSFNTITQINFTGDSVAVTAGSSGTAIVTLTAGTGGGGALSVVSGSQTYSSVSTITLSNSIYISGTAGGGSNLTLSSFGSGAGGGSNGTSGTAGSGGTSGVNGIAGTNGTSGTSATGTNGTAGSPGTSGTGGTSGSNGTNGTGGTSGTSGLSTTLSFFDGGITEVDDVRYIKFSNEFTISDLSNFTASVSMSVVGGGGSANWDTLVNKPPGIVSGSSQIISLLPTGIPSTSLADGHIWIGEGVDTVERNLSTLVSGILGTSGGGLSGFPYSGSARITGSMDVTGSLFILGQGNKPALEVSGSVNVSGSVTSSGFYTFATGTPYITSPSSLNLEAQAGSVNVTMSPFRLASFTDAQTGSLTPQNGDMIYNTTSNKFWGYANGAWVALH